MILYSRNRISLSWIRLNGRVDLDSNRDTASSLDSSMPPTSIDNVAKRRASFFLVFLPIIFIFLTQYSLKKTAWKKFWNDSGRPELKLCKSIIFVVKKEQLLRSPSSAVYFLTGCSRTLRNDYVRERLIFRIQSFMCTVYICVPSTESYLKMIKRNMKRKKERERRGNKIVPIPRMTQTECVT